MLVKTTDPDNAATIPPSSRCPRSARCKLYILAAILSVVTFVYGLNLVYPLTKSLSKDVSKVNVPTTTAEDKDENGRIRYKHTRRKLPGCIIIGTRKAGTRALLTFLNLHPQIIAAKQEVHFFDDNYENGLEWYRKSMPYSFPEQITIEKTPAYFVTSEAPELIYKMNSSILLLLIVRDPVERAVSDYNQIMLKKQARNKPIATFEELAIDKKGNVNHTYNAIKRSVYAHYMARWLRYFPLKQIHIVSGEGLVDDPLPHIHDIEDFLGIDHRITKDNFYFNETRGFYCIRNETMEKCLNPSKGREHPPVRTEVMNKLRAYFRPYNEKFYDMVNKKFGW